MKIIAEIFLDSFSFGWRLDDNQILHTYIIVNRFAKNAKLVLAAEDNKPKKIARQKGLAPSLRALAGYFQAGFLSPFAEDHSSSAVVVSFTSSSLSSTSSVPA